MGHNEDDGSSGDLKFIQTGKSLTTKNTKKFEEQLAMAEIYLCPFVIFVVKDFPAVDASLQGSLNDSQSTGNWRFQVSMKTTAEKSQLQKDKRWLITPPKPPQLLLCGPTLKTVIGESNSLEKN